MRGWKLYVAIALVLLFLWVGNGDPFDGAITFVNEIVRGQRVSHATYGADGVVRVDPQQLASDAGYDLELYALARAGSSEEGISSNATKAAVMWAIVNYANAYYGGSVSACVLHAKNPDHNGYFGTQEDIDKGPLDADGNPTNPSYKKSDRYCSTALDPYQGDIDLAASVLSGAYADPTGGAIEFDRPAGEKHPDKVAARRAAAGLQQVTVAGVDDGIRWWAKAG